MDIDSVITRLLETGETCPENMVPLLESEIYGLCFKAREIFLSQPMLLELVPPLKICGDIHAQYSDLLNLFQCGGYPTSSSYLFLGDYVGPKQSLATICLLLAYKVKFPENFFLLRGHQECAAVNRVCGFYDECRRLYSKELWNVFIHCFNCMPVAAIIDEKIFCCHGGLSPELTSLEQIRAIERPTKIPFKGLLCDLLWSDPDKNIFGWTENERGISYKFGVDVVEHFLEKHNLELICRGHQVVPNGYEFYANRKLVTLFSVPNYHDEFDNFGAMMHVSEDLLCSFFVMKRTSTS